MRSDAVHSQAVTSDSICAVRLACVATTPFGRPVVPLVYTIRAGREGGSGRFVKFVRFVEFVKSVGFVRFALVKKRAPAEFTRGSIADWFSASATTMDAAES